MPAQVKTPERASRELLIQLPGVPALAPWKKHRCAISPNGTFTCVYYTTLAHFCNCVSSRYNPCSAMYASPTTDAASRCVHVEWISRAAFRRKSLRWADSLRWDGYRELCFSM